MTSLFVLIPSPVEIFPPLVRLVQEVSLGLYNYAIHSTLLSSDNSPSHLSITCVAIEGFVLYAGGDYALHLNIMLLVQVMAYVMSDMFAIDIVGH